MKKRHSLSLSICLISGILLSFQAVAQNKPLNLGEEVFLHEGGTAYEFYTVSTTRSNGTVLLYHPFTGTSREVSLSDLASKRVFPVEKIDVQIPFPSESKTVSIEKHTRVIVKNSPQEYESHLVAQIYSDGTLYLFHAPTGSYQTLLAGEASSRIVQALPSLNSLQVGGTVTLRSPGATVGYDQFSVTQIYSDGVVQVVNNKNNQASYLNHEQFAKAVQTVQQVELKVATAAGVVSRNVNVGSKVFLQEKDGSMKEYVVKTAYSDGGVELESALSQGPINPVSVFLNGSKSELAVTESVQSIAGMSTGDDVFLKNTSDPNRFIKCRISAIFGTGSVEVSTLTSYPSKRVMTLSEMNSRLLKAKASTTVTVSSFEGAKTLNLKSGSVLFLRNTYSGLDRHFFHAEFDEGKVGISTDQQGTAGQIMDLKDLAQFAVFDIGSYKNLVSGAKFGLDDPLGRNDFIIEHILSDGTYQFINLRNDMFGHESLMKVPTGLVRTVSKKQGIQEGRIYTLKIGAGGVEEDYIIVSLYEDGMIQAEKIVSGDVLVAPPSYATALIKLEDINRSTPYCFEGENDSDCSRRYYDDKLSSTP
ncbi:MAG: hypothetical protein JNL01_08285 [Bdellovibrionales bacterium]|nr:hypothetical protein [Bdellovibrionales bacterium]